MVLVCSNFASIWQQKTFFNMTHPRYCSPMQEKWYPAWRQICCMRILCTGVPLWLPWPPNKQLTWHRKIPKMQISGIVLRTLSSILVKVLISFFAFFDVVSICSKTSIIFLRKKRKKKYSHYGILVHGPRESLETQLYQLRCRQRGITPLSAHCQKSFAKLQWNS